MSEPPMPTMAGMLSSMGPTLLRCGSAPSETARSKAAAASFDAECHGAHRGAVRLRELLAEGVRLGVDDEIDVALRMQRDVLAAMPGDHGKPQALEQAAQQLRVGRGVFDELEAVGAHGIGQGSTVEVAAIAGLRREIDLVSIVTNDAAPAKLHLEKFLPYRLSVLSNTVSSRDRGGLFRCNFGLSIPEWRVMAVLAANPGLSAAEVTARTAMDKVAVSRAVATLLAAGRLRRTTAPADRRRTHLALTAGRRARLCAGRAHGARIRTQPGGAAVEARSRDARPDSAGFARPRRRTRPRARGMMRHGRMYNRARSR